MLTQNIIGYELSSAGTETISGFNPATQESLPGAFAVATEAEVAQAMQKAQSAWRVYRQVSGQQRGVFLRAIAEAIENQGDTLVQRAIAESGLPEGRILGERGRTCGQLRLFAQLVEEGSWVEATIDRAQPNRTPAPKPDIRKMLVAVGPVVVFTASNFPLAFSTAGGDTASALAAGCPVIVKAHESHPGTNALVADAIRQAAQQTGMPDGVFSTLYGRGFWLGETLVQHPLTRAVAFTGSHRGGRALFDLANQRPEPIPVFAEMGSVNPIFLLPERLKKDADALAAQIAASVNLGAGQFCTNPGLLVCIENADTPHFIRALQTAFAAQPALTMLNPGIHRNYTQHKNAMLGIAEVATEFAASEAQETLNAPPAVASVSAQDFLANPRLQEEIFGPFSLLVKCKNQMEMEQVAAALQGQLTATVMGEAAEILAYPTLLQYLQEKVGRLIFNGVPTGVEVGHAMQHGGPYPATTDSRFTSVGTSAIKRFARPIAFQDCPDNLLPEALRDSNSLKIS
ncbi:MAG TPA: aldehyde dehydrogenase (NADP(+)) [Saprospiraceae bacterium]|nr:aldehyde dehydrogenase (NADP(+)) [Saprospiraceae bacterium]HMP22961.1 aldehyde dehydrogenase (NADP(+)) [Saprospiraceae bacterium]